MTSAISAAVGAAPGRSRNYQQLAFTTPDPSLKARIQRLLGQEVDFVPSKEFRCSLSGERFLAESSEAASAGVRSRAKLPRDLPAHLARMCVAPLLTAEQERDLFRKLNYLKYRANARRSRLDPERSDACDVEAIESDLREASKTRDQIIRSNMRLVISIVKKFVTPRHTFDDLLSEGTMSLMHAVDKFDYSKGFRFSTYAYRAISRQVYRSISDQHKEDGRFDSAASEGLENLDCEPGLSMLDEKRWAQRRELLTGLVGRLDRREQFIVRSRFALGSHRRVRTFQFLAGKLGISKERVRQLEQRAILRLQEMADELGGAVDG